jgi:LPXTG-motif cell wall-anchored protein
VFGGDRSSPGVHRNRGARATAKKYLAMLGIASMLSAGAVVASATPSLADAAGMAGVQGDMQPWTQETNHVRYWQEKYSEQHAVCYKDQYGSITGEGKTVTLNDASGPWLVLIIKGGSVSNDVISNPQPGLAYASPLNAAGNQSNVSHWIVCKSTTPPEPPAETVVRTITAPSAIGPTCDTDGKLVIPETEGITWTGGSNGDGVGVYTLTASAKDGYRIKDGVQTVFQITVLAATNDCPEDVTEIPVPAQPTVTDPCGRNNATWVKPENTDRVTWAVDNGVLTASTTTGYVFPGGTTSHDFGQAPETNKAACVIEVPAKPGVTDACGPGNAAWVVPQNDGIVTWKLKRNGDLVARTVAGHKFTDGTRRHNFGKALETNVAPCLIEVPVPAAPGVTDPCDPGNASWRVPGNGNNVTWSLDGDGNLMATVDPGHTFHDGKATHNFGKAPETNKDACPAVLASVAVAAPVLTPPTCTAAGELKHDEANGYAWNRKDDNGVVVLTAIAKPGFTLVGQTSWTYTVAQLAQLHGARDCPPAVIPPEVEGVKNTAPPTPPVVKGVKHEAAAPLPRTGFESGLYGAAGLLLLLVGSGLVLATRQRSTQDRAH